MPTLPNDRSDQGVLLYASQDGSGSFLFPGGQAGTVQTLTNANYIKSARVLRVGAYRRLLLTVSGTISVGMASVIVIVEAKRIDPQNGSDAAPFDVWKVISTIRCDAESNAGAVIAPAASQTITRAQLAGQSVADGVGGGAATEVLGVQLLTEEHQGASEVRVIVKATNAPNAGDLVVVAANAA